MSESMKKEVYKAIVTGDLTLFSNPINTKDQLLKKTQQNNNILHIAVQHERVHFIKAALNNFPNNTCESLLWEQNHKGNTPLHIAAELGDEAVVELLRQYYEDEFVGVELRRVLPWRMVNSEGNTPAHVALLYGHFSLATNLVANDAYIARIVNNSKETLLHLVIKYQVQGTPEEDLWPIIDLLLKIDSSVACWADIEGSTPLHIAASLKPPRCLQVINAILVSCPEAAEVHQEPSGQCVLHLLANHQVPSYEEGVALLNILEVYALRNCKNSLGDTPLHVAAMNGDRNMVYVLLGSSSNPNIKNKKGVTADSLIQQLKAAPLHSMGNTEIAVEGRRKLTKEECEDAKRASFRYLNEKLDSLGMKYLHSQGPKGGNILHILMSRKFNSDNISTAEEFIGEAIRKSPLLITQQDGNGNTPIHVLAENVKWSARLLNLCYRNFDKSLATDNVARGILYSSPWRVRNIDGDTPLHVAARVRCDGGASKLVELDEEVVEFVNNRKETPLHLRCYISGRIPEDDTYDYRPIVSILTKGNGNQPYMQDVDGLTPLHVASHDHYFPLVNVLLSDFPDCTIITDLKGRNFWHKFVFRPTNKKFPTGSFAISAADNLDNISWSDLMTNKDNDGNTPLHLAIANGHFEFANDVISGLKFDKNATEDRFQKHLEAQNNNGISCYDLIGSAEHLPRQFEKFLWKSNISLYGHRSMYGFPSTKIYDYANTIGVIAALLATITFTAAFTVPGVGRGCFVLISHGALLSAMDYDNRS